ncbi:adenylate/guanylate cyclase domain-containing protein [Neisseria sp. Ec49-e6-T10]|uniref:adenylate/guanylate cyclase domain-containing protein n=1 Tax=Neisseria sp. Ec49-e6-T10 TaxID=3140744 RepID=UPI003EBE58CA
MATYDYKAGKKRVDEILNNKLQVFEQGRVPSEDAFTFDNAYYAWVTGIFVDIRNSSKLFADEDKEKVSKIIRSFTSEIIEILRDDENRREIGIRGDCVYAVYTTPYKSDIYECLDKTFWINTYMRMLNELLEKKGFPTISVGIGISTSLELVVKAGRKGVGINSKVWIGKAVTQASNLSSLGNKGGNQPIILSNLIYDNIIEQLIKTNGEQGRSWFHSFYDNQYNLNYSADVIKSEFNNWISDGMKP